MRTELYDVIIIGGGPAGCSAGIYAGRAKLRALLLDPSGEGGQISITSQVVNYPGVVETSGEALMRSMREQVNRFNVPYRHERVAAVDEDGDLFRVTTDKGAYQAVSVIAATGARPRAAGFEGEDTFRGRGVGYCATCDGEFFTGLDIFVVGGGFAAAEEAIFLTRYARKVHMIVMLPEFTCSQTIADEVLANPDIEVHFSTRMLRLEGEGSPTAAVFHNDATGEEWRYEPPAGETFGTFVFAGYEPVTEYLNELVHRDTMGYIKTDGNLMTNLPGLFAAGDMRPKALRQLVTAVSDGATAATNAEKYVTEQKHALGLRVPPPEPLAGAGENTAGDTGIGDGPAVAPSPATGGSDAQTGGTAAGSGTITPELAAQLQPVLERMQAPVRLAVVLGGDEALGREVQAYAEDFAALSDKLTAEIYSRGENPVLEAALDTGMLPVITLLRQDGTPSGIQFHGVPGGHEFTSFVLSIYNVSGPGQPVEESLAARIAALGKVNVKVGISLTCTMCPDVMAGVGLIAARNPGVTAEMVDIARFPEFGRQHGVMSVPAIVLNDSTVHFGKKSLAELVDILEQA